MDEWFPWEQLPHESGKAWEAFQVYRDLGPSRTLEKAAKTLDKHSTTLGEMGRKYNWEPRVRAWDAYVDRARRSAYLDSQRKMVDTHMKDTDAMRKKAYEGFAALEEKDFREHPRDALAFLQAAIKIEQTVLGLPSEVSGTIDPRTPQEIYFDSLDESAYLRELEASAAVIRSELKSPPKLLEAHLEPEDTANAEPSAAKDEDRRRGAKHGKQHRGSNRAPRGAKKKR